MRATQEVRLNTENVVGIFGTHVLAIFSLFYIAEVNFSYHTLALAIVWYVICNLVIAVGYHRYYAHKSFKVTKEGKWLEVFFLVFGSAAFQGPVSWWSTIHRLHHRYTDLENDPHSIKRGFFWAHMGWLLFRRTKMSLSKEFIRDRFVCLQHKYHLYIGVVSGFILPALIASLWSDFWGGLLVAGFLRLALQYHTTWSVNSFAHFAGRKTYNRELSATDSFWNAFITFGEAAGHSFHHKYEWVWWQSRKAFIFEPARWFIYLCSLFGFVTLKPVPQKILLEAEEN